MRVVDVGGAMLASIQSREGLSATPLTATAADDAVTITVESTAAYTTPCTIWCGQEAMRAATKTATEFTSVTRGYLGTVAREHVYDLDAVPERRPFVTSGPVRLAGRPCRLRVATYDATTGAVSAAAVVWRGIVGDEIRVTPEGWELPLVHASTAMARAVGRGMPSADIEPWSYWYAGAAAGEHTPLSNIRYTRYSAGGATSVYNVAIPSALYLGANGLARAVTSALVDFGPTVPYPYMTASASGDKFVLSVDDDATYALEVTVREGDPIWALGFDAGTYVQEIAARMDAEAQNAPRLFCVDLSRPGTRPLVAVVDNSEIEDGLFVVLPGASYIVVDSLVGSAPVRLVRESTDALLGTVPYAAVDDGDEDKLVLRHAFVHAATWASAWLDGVASAVQRSFGHLAGQPEPRDWCVPILTAADVDYDELTAALGGTPGALALYTGVILEPTEWQEAYGPHLGLLGIAPRVTDDGCIGWGRIRTPTALDAASVEVDADLWSLIDAASVQARVGGSLVTGIELRYNHDYRTDEWPDPSVLRWHDWAAEAGQQRTQAYSLRGVRTSPHFVGIARDRAALDLTVATLVTATHFGLYGRDAVDVEIPCTHLAWQLRCMDVVAVTHPLVPDVTGGTLGVTSRLGLVVGRRLPIMGDDGVASLTVRLPPAVRASGIAPCARATGWNDETFVLSFSGASTPTYSPAGTSDLDRFVAGMDVELWAYDVDEQPVGFPVSAEVDAVDVDGDTLTLTADVLTAVGGLPATGCEVVWPDWDSQNAEQQRWLAIADASYGLGAAPDEAWVWGV